MIRELTSAKDHRITVDNLSILSVSNSQVAKEYVEEGLTNRRVGVTNEYSEFKITCCIHSVYYLRG